VKAAYSLYRGRALAGKADPHFELQLTRAVCAEVRRRRQAHAAKA
jgi:hypothetical protein